MKTFIIVACLVALSVLASASDINANGVGWCQTVGQRCRHTGNMKCCNNLECEKQICRRKDAGCQKMNQECEEFGSKRCCDQLRCRRRGGFGSRRTCQLY